jgi:TPR repeat protein
MTDSAADLLDQAIKHFRGDGVPRDLEQSLKLCEQAYEAGDAEAARFLGTFYEDGVGVEQDLDRARELYAEAADQGFVLANYSLGNLLFRQQRIDEALARWAQGAEAGDAYSIVSLGLCFQEGTGVEQDLNEAIRLYNHAAEGGNSEAMIRLAILYRDGAGVDRDTEKMNELLEKARELNHPFAWYELGRQMLKGNETPDQVLATPAIEYFEKSAQLGQAEAMEVCAEIYCMCSEPDYEKGLPYLDSAIAAESPRAKYIKAILLASGKGMQQDLPAAYALCEQAARAGETDAQRMLAIMLERGDGAEEDLEAAKQWYQAAADNGDPGSAERLKELSE